MDHVWKIIDAFADIGEALLPFHLESPLVAEESSGGRERSYSANSAVMAAVHRGQKKKLYGIFADAGERLMPKFLTVSGTRQHR